MNLYIKVIGFMKPYWKHISFVLLLTLIYVFFNNLSLWISVDFIKELFSPEVVEKTTGSVSTQSPSQGTDPAELLGLKSGSGIYNTVKQYIKSLLIQENKYDTLIVVCFVIFFSFLFKNITHFIRRVLLDFVELNIAIGIRNDLHHKLVQLPLRYFEKKHTGELNSIVFNDVNSINQVLNTSFGPMILSPVQIIVNIAILFSISWQLSLITFTVIPLSAFIMVKIGQSMRRKSRRVFEQIANVVSTFQEAITGIRIVKAFTNEFLEIEKFKEANRNFFRKTFREHRLNFLTSPINETVYVSLVVFLLWFGGQMVYSNEGLTAEDFIRFLLFLFTMIQPIKDLSGVNNKIQQGMAAAERIFSVLDLPTETYDKPEAKTLKSLDDKIIFKDLSFRYSSEDSDVLENVTLDIKKGEMVAFVGPSGSGKTTLINLLPRFYELEKGNITIDGIDTRDYTLHSLRRQMSIVTQDTILFNDTIRMNIAYGVRDVSEDEIINAAKVANAWEFIQATDKGLDTHIGEKGIRLSGGQKQRLSIARAILKNPPILILDEATSSLDTESEKIVQEAIDNLLKSRTVLVIAHRLSTIKNATKIVVLAAGKVDAIGTHEQLMKSSKVYKNLYENQIIMNSEIA